MLDRPTQGDQHDELVIALVGAVGTDLQGVCEDVGVVLGGFGYESAPIPLSGLLRELDWDQELNDEHHDEHIWTYMEAGNELCRRWDRKDALALLATARIHQRREEAGLANLPLRRTAYLLRSLKRPDEVEFLRGVYGSRLILIGAYSSREDRMRALIDKISRDRQSDDPNDWRHRPETLIERDEAEGIPGGQDVRGTYHLADFFVDSRSNSKDSMTRFFRGLFGDPKVTPNKDEFGLFQAEAAGLRSAEMGRQVGVAIASERGQILAVGTNEVPRFGGGAYWTDDDDVDDAREIAYGTDTNDVMKRELAQAIADRVQPLLAANTEMPNVVEQVSATRLGDLIEFGRATHAEMAAITDAARTGIAIAGATMFTTTFPCHNCTRHIISAGIKRVVYVAPYAKSLARDLHHDAITVAAARPSTTHVNLEPFVGVAPRRYMDIFKWERKRKKTDGSGETIDFDPKTATPRLADLEPDELVSTRLPYLVREGVVQRLVKLTGEAAGLAVVENDDE